MPTPHHTPSLSAILADDRDMLVHWLVNTVAQSDFITSALKRLDEDGSLPHHYFARLRSERIEHDLRIAKEWLRGIMVDAHTQEAYDFYYKDLGLVFYAVTESYGPIPFLVHCKLRNRWLASLKADYTIVCLDSALKDLYYAATI